MYAAFFQYIRHPTIPDQEQHFDVPTLIKYMLLYL